ncbi:MULTISPECIES: phosphopantetheine-binding protein [Sphingobium]|uniref:phosphopantetheine-binding protein n=1 Tax=Sphingobium TaxID=165695 RepID=UPI0015EC068B|nr:MULTISPECIES: phosphopantetheine-binding protein [Sphingobium]
MQTSQDREGNGASNSAASDALRASLVDVLGLAPQRVDLFDEETGLFGSLPELDSMAVATLLTDLEDRLDIVIDDDDVDMDSFETFGSLAAMLSRKLDSRAA